MKKMFFATAVCASFSTTVYAEISTKDAWINLQKNFENNGYTVSADVNENMSIVEVKNLSLGMEIDSESNISISLPDLLFVQMSNGVVSIDPNYEQNVKITYETKDQSGSAIFSPSAEKLRWFVQGDTNDIRTRYSADSFSLVLNELQIPKEDLEGIDLAITMTLNGIEGIQTNSGIINKNRSGSFSADNAIFSVNFKNLSDDSNLQVNYQVDGIVGAGTEQNVTPLIAENMSAALSQGYAGSGSMTHQGASVEFSINSPEMVGQGSLTSGAGEFTGSVSSQGLEINSSGKETALFFSGQELPFPISLSLGENYFGITAPSKPSDEEQAFGLKLGMVDVELSDILWSIFDPQEQLARDPATVELDISGAAKLFVDYLDPTIAENPETWQDIPGMLSMINISKLNVSAMGTELITEGEFSFDNEDLETFDGLPRPEGNAKIIVRGANALIDTIIAMGIVQPEQAMGARMMFGMFTVPTGEDELTSNIEVNNKGHILANGQRLR